MVIIKRQHWIFPLLQIGIVMVIALSLKYYLANTTLENLRFLLWPPALATQFFFSESYYWSSEHGYVFPELTLYINRSCSAINFLTILFLSLSSLVLLYLNGKHKVYGLLLTLLLCYPLCIAVNAFRIILATQLNSVTQSLSLSMRENIHELAGGICFFGSLLLIFIVAEKFTRKFRSSRQNHLNYL